MTASLRHVKTLRLSARREDLIRRGILLFEDALRTASFPGAGPERVIFVRKLDIGIIRADAPPASIALVLERCVRDLMSSAVHGDEPGAERANVVFFRDDVEPLVVLARRMARGETTSAWYFTHALPGFVPTMTRDEAFRLVLRAASDTTAGPAAVVALIEALHSCSALDPLLDALQWSDGPALVRAFGGVLSDKPALLRFVAARGAPAPVLRSLSWARTIATRARVWGPEDARSVWLAAMALIIEVPGRMGDVRIWQRAAIVAATEHSRAMHTDDARSDTRHVPRQAVIPDVITLPRETEPFSEERAQVRNEVDSVPSVEHQPSFVATTEDEPYTIERSSVVDSPQPTARRPMTAQPTTVGGLFFLIPVLERLGIAQLLEAHPELCEVDFPARMFLYVAPRLGALNTDSIFSVLGDHLSELPVDIAPNVMRELSRLYLEMRRFCRRNLRLGLRTIVCRAGRIFATRTHLDVMFDIEQADIRVRRVGLDVNPGWVPWFGRVVQYHYLYGENS